MVTARADTSITQKLSPVFAAFIRARSKAIKNNYGMEIDDIDYDISKINIKSIIFGIIGLFILIINILTEKYIGAVLSNFICVVWWVAIWEMVELQTMEKPDLKWKRLNYQQLYDADINFIFEKQINYNDIYIKII